MFCDIPHNWYKLQYEGLSPRDALWSLVFNGQKTNTRYPPSVLNQAPQLGNPTCSDFHKRRDCSYPCHHHDWDWNVRSMDRGCSNTELLYNNLSQRNKNMCCHKTHQGEVRSRNSYQNASRKDCFEECALVLCQFCHQTCNKQEEHKICHDCHHLENIRKTQCTKLDFNGPFVDYKPYLNLPNSYMKPLMGPCDRRNENKFCTGHRKSKFLTALLKRKRINHQLCSDIKNIDMKYSNAAIDGEQTCKPCCHQEVLPTVTSLGGECHKVSCMETSCQCKDVQRVPKMEKHSIHQAFLCCNNNRLPNQPSMGESFRLKECVVCYKGNSMGAGTCCCKDVRRTSRLRKEGMYHCCRSKNPEKITKICSCEPLKNSEFKECDCTTESEDGSGLKEVSNENIAESGNCRNSVLKTVQKLVHVFDGKSCRDVITQPKNGGSDNNQRCETKESELLIGKIKQVGDCCVVTLQKSLSHLKEKSMELSPQNKTKSKNQFVQFKSISTQMSSTSISENEVEHKPTLRDSFVNWELLETQAALCYKLIKETLLSSAEATKGTCTSDDKEKSNVSEKSDFKTEKKSKKYKFLFRKRISQS